MKRLFPWTSSAEGRLEAWLAKQHEARVYSGETTPVGSCPDDSFLRELARKSKSIDLMDQRIDHVANCAKCLPRLTLFRTGLRAQQRRWQLALAGAACVILIAALLFVPQWSQHRHENASSNVAVSKTVDLWTAGAYRGQQPAARKTLVLPARKVRLTIILPEFSQSGRYLVAVTGDQTGTGILSEAIANSIPKGKQQTVSVVLDLRATKAGKYFLSTTYEKGQAAYYYPLRIK